MSLYNLHKGIKKNTRVRWVSCGGYWYGQVSSNEFHNPNGFSWFKVVPDGKSKSEAITLYEDKLEVTS